MRLRKFILNGMAVTCLIVGIVLLGRFIGQAQMTSFSVELLARAAVLVVTDIGLTLLGASFALAAEKADKP
jgi:hypothetical protein